MAIAIIDGVGPVLTLLHPGGVIPKWLEHSSQAQLASERARNASQEYSHDRRTAPAMYSFPASLEVLRVVLVHGEDCPR